MDPKRPGGRDHRLSVALTVAALALTLLAAPSSLAHSVTEPLPVEVHVLADEGEDAFYWYDGYDLFNLLVREAYHVPTAQEGLVFRFTLYGGFTPAPTVDALHIDIGATGGDGETVVRLTTTDDVAWTTDQAIILFNETMPDAPPFTGVTTNLEVFIPNGVLGVERGEEVGAIWMHSYAGDDLRDAAPGGVFVPGTAGAAEVPTESSRLVDTLMLDGPNGYVETEAVPTTDGVELTIKNPFAGNGQHIRVHAEDAPGWAVSFDGPSQANVDGGSQGTFRLVVDEATPGQVVPLLVTTDVGGLESYYLGLKDGQYAVASTSEGFDPPLEPTDDSPAAGVGLVLAGLVGAALVAVRRRRA